VWMSARALPRKLLVDRHLAAVTFAHALPVTIRPPFDPRANAVMARSISPGALVNAVEHVGACASGLLS